MDTNSFDDERIVLHEPGELVAAVPHLLGFHPTDSLVVLALDAGDDNAVTMVMRVSLPQSDHYQRLAELLRGKLVWQDFTKVALVVVGGTDDHPGNTLPHHDLVTACTAHFAEAGIETCHEVWTEGTTGGALCRCYRDVGCEVHVPQSDAFAHATDGRVYSSRNDMVAMLTPDDNGALARRAGLLDSISQQTADTDPREQLRLLEAAVSRAAEGILPESDDDIVALTVALSNHTVRDVCLVQPDQRRVDAAERLWAALSRSTPAPERAEPACLLAFSAYQRGNGVLAGIALDCAKAADPGHRLSELVQAALTIGHPPSRMRYAAECASRYSRDLLTQIRREDRP